MFSFEHIVLLAAVITCTQALTCYSGNASGRDHPSTSQICPSSTKYCVAATVKGNEDTHTHSCDTGILCKKEGCETANLITTCCCTSDLCNEGVKFEGMIPTLLSTLSQKINEVRHLAEKLSIQLKYVYNKFI